MIQSVTVTNHLNESIKMELRFPEKSGFLIQGIDGLGPVKADISTTEISTLDGSKYNSARANSRNIVFRLGFYGTNIEYVRQLTYKYFPLKRRIKMLFETDNRISYVYGYVESNEPNIFSETEDAVISVLCPNSYLSGTGTIEESFSSVTSLFEFPFESVSPDYIEFSELEMYFSKLIVYSGDAPVGITISIHFIGTVTNIEIINVETLESIYIDTTKVATIVGSAIASGDEIIISTVPGNKYAIFIRSGTEYNIFNALDKYPDWLTIEKGDNIFTYTADTGGANMQVVFQYSNAYEGI